MGIIIIIINNASVNNSTMYLLL